MIFTSLIGTLGTCFSLEIRWKELFSILTRNKGETEASDNYLYQRMCSGLTMEVVNEVCLVLQGLHTNDKIMEKFPYLEEKNMEKRF